MSVIVMSAFLGWKIAWTESETDKGSHPDLSVGTPECFTCAPAERIQVELRGHGAPSTISFIYKNERYARYDVLISPATASCTIKFGSIGREDDWSLPTVANFERTESSERSTVTGLPVSRVSFQAIESPSPDYQSVVVECNVVISPHRTSYVGRGITTRGIGWDSDSFATRDAYLSVDASALAEEEDFRIFGQKAAGDREYARTIDQFSGWTDITWKDESSAANRDVLILLIGLLLGLSGACLLEFARPWFEEPVRIASRLSRNDPPKGEELVVELSKKILLEHTDGRRHILELQAAAEIEGKSFKLTYLLGNADIAPGSLVADWGFEYLSPIPEHNNLGEVSLSRTGRTDIEIESLRGIGLGSLLMNLIIGEIQRLPVVPVIPPLLSGEDAEDEVSKRRRNRFSEKLGFKFDYKEGGVWGEARPINSDQLIQPESRPPSGWNWSDF